MTRLEDVHANAAARGILTDAQVAVVTSQGLGANALVPHHKDPAGQAGNILLYRNDERRLKFVELGLWSIDADVKPYLPGSGPAGWIYRIPFVFGATVNRKRVGAPPCIVNLATGSSEVAR